MKKLLIHGRNSKPSSGGGGDPTIEYVSYDNYISEGGISKMTHVTDTVADSSVSDTMYGMGDPFYMTIAGDISASDLNGCSLMIDNDMAITVSYIDGVSLSGNSQKTFELTDIHNYTGIDYYEDYDKNVYGLTFGNSFMSSDEGRMPPLFCTLYSNSGEILLEFVLNLEVWSPKRYFSEISYYNDYGFAQSMANPITLSLSALPGETIDTYIYGMWSEDVNPPTAKVISSTNSSITVGSYITYNYDHDETDCVCYYAELPIGSSPCEFTLEFNNDSYCRVTFDVKLG